MSGQAAPAPTPTPPAQPPSKDGLPRGLVIAAVVIVIGVGAFFITSGIDPSHGPPSSPLDPQAVAAANEAWNRVNVPRELRDDLAKLRKAETKDFGSSLSQIQSRITAYANSGVASLGSEACQAAVQDAGAKNEAVARLEAATTEPEKPDKEPRLSDFLEVRHLCGTFRGRFNEGGIVITRGDDYYVIKGADVPIFARVCGYVRSEGFTTLGIEGGRLAEVMNISDHVAYKEELPAAKQAYAEAVVEYREKMKAWRQAQTEAGRKARERAQLELSLARSRREETVSRIERSCLATEETGAPAPSAAAK